MRANVGDMLIIQGHVVGRRARKGEIIGVRGPEGAPPYLVRFGDGHEQLVYPGPDARIEPGTAE
jgi:hypothetical protein